MQAHSSYDCSCPGDFTGVDSQCWGKNILNRKMGGAKQAVEIWNIYERKLFICVKREL
jgi:hypothetical protein